jgi:hypothetical protein
MYASSPLANSRSKHLLAFFPLDTGTKACPGSRQKRGTQMKIPNMYSTLLSLGAALLPAKLNTTTCLPLCAKKKGTVCARIHRLNCLLSLPIRQSGRQTIVRQMKGFAHSSGLTNDSLLLYWFE